MAALTIGLKLSYKNWHYKLYTDTGYHNREAAEWVK